MKKYLIPILLAVTAVGLAGEDFDLLLVIPERYGANTNFNIDHFQSMGFRITTAGTADTMSACHGALPPFPVDTLIPQLTDPSSYCGLAIMPSRWVYIANPYGDLINSPEALQLMQNTVAGNLPLWSTCAGPLVLAAADLLQGVSIQGREGPDSTFIDTYEAAGANYLGWGLLPVMDGCVITTSRGQYYQRENCQALISTISSLETPSLPSPVESGTSSGIREMKLSSGGQVIFTGYRFSTGGNHSDLLLGKTDSQGNTIWETTTGTLGFQYGNSVIESENGELTAAGYTTENGNEDFYLVRTDSQGNLIWERTFGSDSLDICMSLCCDSSGNLYLCGYTTGNTQGESDVLVMKTDPSGNLIWEERFGGTGPETGDMIQFDSSGNLLIAGSTGSFTSNSDAYLLWVDTSGTLIREEYYGAQGGEGGYDRANSATVTPQGNIALTGESNDPDKCGIYFVLTDAEGNQTAETFHGNPFYDYGNHILSTEDGGFIIAGATKDGDSCDNNLYVIKLDENGNSVWEQEFGEVNTDEWGTCIIAMPDGSYLAGGQRENANGEFETWMVQVEDTGQGMEGEVPKGFHVTPNPASSAIQFEVGEAEARVMVYDITGHLVMESRVSPGNTALHLQSLPVGTYSIAILQGNRRETTRFTLIR